MTPAPTPLAPRAYTGRQATGVSSMPMAVSTWAIELVALLGRMRVVASEQVARGAHPALAVERRGDVGATEPVPLGAGAQHRRSSTRMNIAVLAVDLGAERRSRCSRSSRCTGSRCAAAWAFPHGGPRWCRTARRRSGGTSWRWPGHTSRSSPTSPAARSRPPAYRRASSLASSMLLWAMPTRMTSAPASSSLKVSQLIHQHLQRQPLCSERFRTSTSSPSDSPTAVARRSTKPVQPGQSSAEL